MNFKISTAAAHAIAERLRDCIDRGGAPGAIRFFGGAMPYDPDTPTEQELLAECVLAFPCGEAVGPALQFFNIQTATDTRAGRATWFQIVDSDGYVVVDGDVGEPGSGATLLCNTAELRDGGTWRVNNFEICMSLG